MSDDKLTDGRIALSEEHIAEMRGLLEPSCACLEDDVCDECWAWKALCDLIVRDRERGAEIEGLQGERDAAKAAAGRLAEALEPFALTDEQLMRYEPGELPEFRLDYCRAAFAALAADAAAAKPDAEAAFEALRQGHREAGAPLDGQDATDAAAAGGDPPQGQREETDDGK